MPAMDSSPTDGLGKPIVVLGSESSLRVVFVDYQTAVENAILIDYYRRVRRVRVACAVGRIRRAKLTVVVPNAL